MKFSLKLFATSLLAFFLVGLAPLSALAVDIITPVCDGQNGVNNSSVCKDNSTNSSSNPLFGTNGVLTRAISIISIVVGVVAIIVILIAAIRFMNAQSNPQTINLARNQIIYALVGIVVAGMAQAIVAFVLKKL